MTSKTWLRVYAMAFASVYPQYIAKAEKKGRTRAEVDEIIRWLTGYSQGRLEAEIAAKTDFETMTGRHCPPDSAACRHSPRPPSPTPRAARSRA